MQVSGPGRDEIIRQTHKITASRIFAGSERMSRLLRYIVTESVAGRGDQLKEYTLAQEVFQRPSSFDPRVDSTVRSEASRLRGKLQTYYETEGSSDTILISLPKGGYQVIFEDRESRDQDSNECRRSSPHRIWHRWAALAGGAVVLASGLAYVLGRSGPAMRIVPATTFSGIESDPALSPDTRQLAFSWNGEKEDNFDIYVKLVDAGKPLRLTAHAARDYGPAWSPDGRFIAFSREDPDRGIFIVPALGGTERRVTDRFVPPPGIVLVGAEFDWSPDGKHLALTTYAPGTAAFITLFNVENGESRRLTSPPKISLGDYQPRFAPDGRSLAFLRFPNSGSADIHRIELSRTLAAESAPRRITFENGVPRGYAWLPDESGFVFSSIHDGVSAMWRVPASGSRTLRQMERAGENALSPSFGRTPGRMVYTRSFVDSNIWRLDLSDLGSPPTRVISSSRADQQATYSPDDRKIAFVSDRTGRYELWLCDADGTNPAQLTNGAILPGTPRWSPDSRYLAYTARPDGNADIYVIGVQGGKPRRMTTELSTEVNPRWSRDGRWIYFSSSRTGRHEGWKIPADGTGAAVQVTRNGGWRLEESIDGRFLYFDKYEGDGLGIFRVPIEGGAEQLLLDLPRMNWTLAARGIYHYDDIPIRTFRFLDFASGQSKQLVALEQLNTRFPATPALSRDERWLIYSNIDQTISDIMLVENLQ